MKKTVFTLLFLILFLGCSGQEKENKTTQTEKKETVKPKEKWDVKKEYDEFGNLIKYDSIYSYSYSTIEGDTIQVNLDSIMTSFRGHFEENRPFKWNEQFSYFPQNDSLFMNDFFKDDYFFKTWQHQHSELDKMIKRMDSSRNVFLKRFHPGLLESKDKTKR